MEIAGDSATGIKAIVTDLDPSNDLAREFVAGMMSRYGYETLPRGTRWYVGSAYDVVHITAECLKEAGDDQDANGFRDCL